MLKAQFILHLRVIKMENLLSYSHLLARNNYHAAKKTLNLYISILIFKVLVINFKVLLFSCQTDKYMLYIHQIRLFFLATNHLSLAQNQGY